MDTPLKLQFYLSCLISTATPKKKLEQFHWKDRFLVFPGLLLFLLNKTKFDSINKSVSYFEATQLSKCKFNMFYNYMYMICLAQFRCQN